MTQQDHATADANTSMIVQRIARQSARAAHLEFQDRWKKFERLSVGFDLSRLSRLKAPTLSLQGIHHYAARPSWLVESRIHPIARKQFIMRALLK